MAKPRSTIGPWHHLAFLRVGGLVAIGFPSDQHLLAVSWTGRGLFDIQTCQRLDRSAAPLSQDCLAADHQHAKGIGAFADQMIPIVGLWGGREYTQTDDGWSLKNKSAWGNVVSSVLTDPNGAKIKPVPLMAITEYRAISFNPTGQFLVLASSSDVQVLQRS